MSSKEILEKAIKLKPHEKIHFVGKAHIVKAVLNVKSGILHLCPKVVDTFSPQRHGGTEKNYKNSVSPRLRGNFF